MSQFLELLSQRCVQHDDATSSDYVTSSRGQISEFWKEVFLCCKALTLGFRRRTEKNNEKYPESEQSLSGAAHLLGNLGTF